MTPERISPHLTYREATASQLAERRGIRNEPSADDLAAMHLVAAQCFEPAREHFGVPIGVSSFFRCPTLNRVIGGSPTSDHQYGRAIDVDADIHGGLTNAALFDWLAGHVPFDQLIWELGTEANPAWVHISYRATGNRHQVLRAIRGPLGVRYQPFSRPSEVSS